MLNIYDISIYSSQGNVRGRYGLEIYPWRSYVFVFLIQHLKNMLSNWNVSSRKVCPFSFQVSCKTVSALYYSSSNRFYLVCYAKPLCESTWKRPLKECQQLQKLVKSLSKGFQFSFFGLPNHFQRLISFLVVSILLMYIACNCNSGWAT